MEKSLYYKIMKDTIESKETHSKIVNLIKEGRENWVGEEHLVVDLGKLVSFQLYCESKKAIRNIEKLYKFDNFLEEELPKYKSHKFVGVLKN
jgi:hypothetical protein